MIKPVVMSLAILFALPALSQVEPSAVGGEVTPTESEQMVIPPPISVIPYPTELGSEVRTNYISSGLIFTSSYEDNVLPGYTPVPISDYSYYILPTFSLRQQASRHAIALTYTPGFQFYQNATSLNAVDQNAEARIQYRFSRRATLNLRDSFQQNSSAFDQPFVIPGAVSGAIQGATSIVIAPYANQVMNALAGEFSYQFALHGMIGGGGTSSILNYPQLSQVPGLLNSTSTGGAAFYNRRFKGEQYSGVVYQYTRSTTSPVSSTTQLHQLALFYTLYWHRKLTFSLAAGPEYYDVAQPGAPTSSAWSPSVTASLGWQERHFNFAANYSHLVSAGGGLLGAYKMNSADGEARWQITPMWTMGLTASYSIVKNAIPLMQYSYPGGHSVIGEASIQRRLGERITIQGGYDRLHQSYSGVALVNNAPDSNRGFISIAYQFTHRLGR